MKLLVQIIIFLSSSISLAMPLWMKEINQNIETLSQDIYIYHWAKGARAKIKVKEMVDPLDPRLFQYLQMRTQGYWNNVFSTSLFGEGLYFATDPYVSRDHGDGENWILVRMILPKGLKFLDVVHSTLGHKQFSKAAQANLAAAGCPYVNYFDALLMTPGCRQFVKQLQDVLGLSVFVYDYRDPRPLPGCIRRTPNAFFFISEKIFSAQNTILLNDLSRSEWAREDQGYIQKYFAVSYGPLWSQIEAADDASFQMWMNNSIDGCNGNSVGN